MLHYTEHQQTRQQPRPWEVTPPQRRYLRRLAGAYVRQVRYGPSTPAFRFPAVAICYALARALEPPESKTAASRLIKVLRTDPLNGILTAARQQTVYARAWRRRALGPLRRRYGYPHAGWLARLNTAADAALSRTSEDRRRHLDEMPEVYRNKFIDPLFRDQEGAP